MRAMWSNASRVAAAVRPSAASAAAAAPNAAGFGLGPSLGCCASGAGGRLRRVVVAGRARRVVREVLLNKKINQEVLKIAFTLPLAQNTFARLTTSPYTPAPAAKPSERRRRAVARCAAALAPRAPKNRLRQFQRRKPNKTTHAGSARARTPQRPRPRCRGTAARPNLARARPKPTTRHDRRHNERQKLRPRVPRARAPRPPLGERTWKPRCLPQKARRRPRPSPQARRTRSRRPRSSP